MPLSILVVDDFEPFRRYLCSVLNQDARYAVIGAAADGIEGIEKAAQLQPDLILLDVGLPKLNGREAARQMRKVAPAAKIVFVSLESSFEVVEAALRAGALSYIHKLRVTKDLFPGIEAVIRGAYFVSSVLKEKASKYDNGGLPVRHEVQFYSDDEIVLKSLTDFIAAQLKDGKTTIVVATEPHRDGVFERLNDRGVDVDQAIATGVIIPLDAVETLGKFMDEEMPAPGLFFDVMGELIETATRKTPRVAACGEIAPQLAAVGKAIQAIRIEQLWDLIAHRFGLDTLCAYSLAHVAKDSELFRDISAEHSVIYSM
jgi:DNA-binding NarL/FixJ family response regulator